MKINYQIFENKLPNIWKIGKLPVSLLLNNNKYLINSINLKNIIMKTCNKCNTPKEIKEFRIHKSGYTLNQCKSCEKLASKLRAIKRKNKTNTFMLKTKNGRIFKASKSPVPNSRKSSHYNSSEIIYVLNAKRDEARAIFANYANVPMTGISTPLV